MGLESEQAQPPAMSAGPGPPPSPPPPPPPGGPHSLVSRLHVRSPPHGLLASQNLALGFLQPATVVAAASATAQARTRTRVIGRPWGDRARTGRRRRHRRER